MDNKKTEKAKQTAGIPRRENTWQHVSFHLDPDLFESIKCGEFVPIKGGFKRLFSSGDGHLSADPHRQAIYEFVATVTLATRYAIEGGAGVEQAYSLGGAYINFADKTNSVKEVYAIYPKMLKGFAKMAKRSKGKNKTQSPAVTQTIEYIENHLHEKILLKEVAKVVGRNDTYLSVLFKKETGLAMAAYINRERVEAAKRMLRESDMKTSEIAKALAFGSTNYFTKLFTRSTGITPRNYRLGKDIEESLPS